jgi:hypothetical protein
MAEYDRVATQLPRFGKKTNKRIRRESWESVTQLKRAIKEYIKDRNIQGGSFKWTKEPEEILRKIQKARGGTIMQNV